MRAGDTDDSGHTFTLLKTIAKKLVVRLRWHRHLKIHNIVVDLSDSKNQTFRIERSDIPSAAEAHNCEVTPLDA